MSLPRDIRPAVIDRLMKKTGVTLPPERFVYEVTRAYEAVSFATQAENRIPAILRGCHSYPVFHEALRQAATARQAPSSVLVLGCAEGHPGQDHLYAKEEWNRIWPATKRVEVWDVSTPALWNWEVPDGAFDCVLTHSMAHYMFNLERFFAIIASKVRPGGVYVMGKEANARYFAQRALDPPRQQISEERRNLARRRRYLDPKPYVAFVTRALGAPPPFDIGAGTNNLLRRRIGARGALSLEEIARMVEAHRPRENGSPDQVGLDGFDPEAVVRDYLTDFDVAWTSSSGWLGYIHPTYLTPEWKQRDQELGRQFPSDGVYFSAVYRRRPGDGTVPRS